VEPQRSVVIGGEVQYDYSEAELESLGKGIAAIPAATAWYSTITSKIR
jgi:hypothetical protein